jgi:hypothetical protein
VTITITLDGNEAALTGTTKGDETQRAAIRRPWVWSRPQAAYVLPRSLRPETRAHHVRAVTAALEAAGHPVTVEDTGVRLTVAEERAQERDRLEDRADRHAARAERDAAEAAAQYATYERISGGIPLGQPILVGHHSEGRHRRDLARMDTAMGRSVAADRSAEEAARLADGITSRLAGVSTGTLRRRIDRGEVEVRDLDRRLNGTAAASMTRRPAEGEYRERLLGLRARAQEAVDLDRAELARRAEQDGVRVWGREDFRAGDDVLDRFGWTRVLRVNPKSLTVPHGFIGGATRTLGYDRVKARRRDGDVTPQVSTDPYPTHPIGDDRP